MKGILWIPRSKSVFLVLLALSILAALILMVPPHVRAQQTTTTPQPVVAIHISELTQALETMPARPPTPTGSGTTGYEWWVTAWHYFVMPESLKEALRSDGTPFVEVSDADIAAGRLLYPDGSPRYPIMLSLASEALANNEIAPLRDFVAAGGLLFIGSSSFTRNPDGTTRGDFALANELGLHMVSPNLQNWYENSIFSKVVEHRLVTHIPAGTLDWNMPTNSGEIPCGESPYHAVALGYHYVFQVSATSDTTVIASGDSGPLLAAKQYGKGNFIYHGAMQPILGFGGYDSGMYAYLIYRKAIEWAFEAANLPIIKLSPWRYEYDAAFIVRHDFENNAASIRSIENSAAFENSVGAKGDYYFCTGTLRQEMSDKNTVISSLQRAVTNYGTTVGSHNGGLKNPDNPSLTIADFDYWHWGPDEALDTTPPGYSSGKAYAKASVSKSFTDIEGWLAGFDNGRAGCGRAGNCPRIWASPYFDSVREDSNDILEALGAVTMTEQKISPFPHFTLSTQTAGKRYSHVTLPLSEWYVGSSVAEAMNFEYTSTAMRAAVDFYYNLGALINIYGHLPSIDGTLQGEYVKYCVAKPKIWATNAVGATDWWQLRSNTAVTPAYSMMGNTGIAQATITGATDPGTTVEIAIPNRNNQVASNLQVFIDGAPASSADYRTIGNAIKVRVGNTNSSVKVQYTLLESWTQTDWVGEGGQSIWADETRYNSASGIDDSFNGQVSLAANSTVLLSDDFTTNSLSPWVAPLGTWSVSGGVLQGSGSPSQYSYAYTSTTPLWGDYIVQGRIRIPAGSFGGGIGGRVNPATGAHYGAWVYPAGSAGGSNLLKLWKFRGWTDVGVGVPMQQVNLPDVGTGWHTLQMTFVGNRIFVYYDGSLQIDLTDNNYDSRAPYLSGGISVDWWTGSLPYTMVADDISVVALPTYASSGVLLSSAFDGREGVQWQTISWDAASGGSTNVCVRTRTADLADQLVNASWSDCYATPGSGLMSANRRWIQYQLELTTSDPSTSPFFDEIGISYLSGVPGGSVLVIDSLLPTSAIIGGAAFTLTLNGSGFVSGSVVQWNGAGRTTTFVSSTQLTAAIPAADIAVAGTVQVTVFNPTPGGGTSNAQTFTVNTVNNPVPTTASLNPTSANSGGAGFTLTVNGSGFVATSVVRWNGTSRTTTFASSTQLTAAIPAGDIATAGTAQVTVFNSTPGGGTSNAQTFTVNTANNPVPTTASLNPTSANSGGVGFTLTVNGSGFVATSVVRWNGTSRTTTFASSTQLTAAIPAGDIATAGTAQVTVFNSTPGGGTSNAQTFTVNTANNPVPTTASLNPTSANSGGVGFTLTVNGSGFVSGSVVQWNGAGRTTTFVSSTQLTAAIPAADIAAAGTAQVTVFNPTPGGGTSNAQTFTVNAINNPVPVTTSLNPPSRTAGGTGFTLTVNGSGFVNGSVVQWNGAGRTTTFVSSTQLTAAIPAGDIATAGTVQATVFNPTPGGGTSNAQTFTVNTANNPVPTTASLNPTSANSGGAGFALTVNGSGFVSSSVVRWNGTNHTTTFVSSTQLTAAIPAGDIATAGTAQVTVFNPAPGGGTSNAQTFTVNTANNPVPTTASLNPTSANSGGAGFALTVNGSGFVSSSVVRWNGTNHTTTFVSSTQLTAAIPAGDIATAGTAQVTVFNPTPGGGTSNAQTFTVNTANNPVPTTTNLNPTSRTAGGAGFTLTVNGSGFVATSVVRWNGTNRTTTFVSSTQLTAAIPAGDIATAGTAQVTVFNSTPGGGTSNTQTFTVNTVNNPVPTITTLNPPSRTAGATAFTLTVIGSGFVSTSVVQWNGANRTTKFVSSTQLTAQISAADIKTPGTAQVTVFTPAPGGGTSNARSFSIR